MRRQTILILIILVNSCLLVSYGQVTKGNSNQRNHKTKVENIQKNKKTEITQYQQHQQNDDSSQSQQQNQQISILIEKKQQSQRELIDVVNFLSKSHAEILSKPSYKVVKISDQTQQIFAETIFMQSTDEQKTQKEQEKKSVAVFSSLQSKLNLNNSNKKKQPAQTSLNSHSLSLFNHQNAYFTGKLAVGQTREQFDVIFDSGSSLTFINSQNCVDAGCKNKKRYDSSKSNTYKQIPGGLSAQFGSGYLEGTFASENFYVNQIQVTNAFFIETNSINGEAFEQGKFNGVVGLSFPNEIVGQPTFFDFMMDSNKLNKNMFAFYMNRKPRTSDSELTFGGYNKHKMADPQDIQWHRNASQKFWIVKCQKILIGGQNSRLCSQQNPCRLMIDSGTSLFSAPSAKLQDLLSIVTSYSGGCTNLSGLPQITFVIDDAHYPIYPEEYILTVSKYGKDAPTMHSPSNEVISCSPAFYAMDPDEDEGPYWIVGDIFMSKYYTIFDRGNGYTFENDARIGFSLAKGMSRKSA